ncbi:EF-hand domain-containing protein [Bradyrhizobium sp. 18BD]
MLFALGAVSTALDAIQSLTNSKSSSSTQKTGSSQSASTNPFAIDSSNNTTTGATSSVNAGKYPQISPETMNALFAAQSQSSDATGSATTATSSSSTSSTSRDAALKDLFSQLDADGDITKSEFENALGAGGTNLAQADDVFSKMDSNSDGSVNLDEMSKALKSGHHGGHHHAQGAGDASGSGSDSSSSSSSGGSTSTTTTAADGSTTTTVTYADGFKMSTTVPGANSSRTSAYDLFAQLMQQQGGQGQGASAAAGSSMSMSV